MNIDEGAGVRAARFIDVLKERDFLLLWMGQLISQFGDRLNQMALIAIIAAKRPGMATEISRLFFFMLLPAVILGPVVGVLVDRWDHKKTMIATDLIRALLVISIPFAARLEHMGPIYIVVFTIFALTRFFIPAKLAIIPTLVKRDELFVANSVSTMATMLATIFGMVLGGLAVAWIGARLVLFMDAGTYLISALFILAMAGGKAKGHKRRLKSFIDDLSRGLRYLSGHRTVYGGAMVLFCLMAAAGIISVAYIVFLQRQLGINQMGVERFIRVLGLLGSIMGLGMLLGIGLTGVYGERLKKTYVFTLPLVVLGGAVFLITFTRSIFLMGIIVFFSGFLGPSILIFINASIHRLIPKSVHGRVFSALDIVNNFALLFSILLAGYLASYIDERTILQILGITLVASGVMAYIVGIFSKRLWG